jgi:hypothetical protein
MQPMNTQNEFWTRHELPYDLEPLEAKVNQAIDHLVEGQPAGCRCRRNAA